MGPDGHCINQQWSVLNPRVIDLQENIFLPLEKKGLQQPAKLFPKNMFFFCESAGNVRTTVAGDTFSKKTHEPGEIERKKSEPIPQFDSHVARCALQSPTAWMVRISH